MGTYIKEQQKYNIVNQDNIKKYSTYKNVNVLFL